MALVGRPNVGKSSLLNVISGTNRAIVSDLAGTTRDALDLSIVQEVDGEPQMFRLIDTAGVRRKGKVRFGSEFFMVNRAFKAIKRSDVAVLVLDATEGLRDQDRTLAERIAEEGRAAVIVLNKWDAVVSKDDSSFNKAVSYVQDTLPALRWAEVVVTSAVTGQRTRKILGAVARAAASHKRRVSTRTLNEVLQDAVLWQAPPSGAKGGARLYYCSQVSSAPPTIVVFCNDPKLIGDGYKRYLDRKFREALGFEGSPIRFMFRGKRLREVARVGKGRQAPNS
mmetsp:Transcript_12204/g.41304  ORF Transcript_12204/g.41304 Transcript_12204/m.41304 type:complete len:281 (+) Transcript_12204:3-845(+)